MAHSPMTPGVVAGRLEHEALSKNFADLHPPLDAHEAQVAADRCYFCYDAPCMEACPTSIDIPLFIRQILTGTPEAAGKTILDQNILGGMCARVCPTETLCEEVCVRETAEGEPVQIGRLQRFATDTLMWQGPQPYTRAAPTGKRVAVVGAGPAGLACAHRLAMYGHDVTLYDAREKAGGLNEFGIASYKSVDDFASREVEWLMGIGGIELKLGAALGNSLHLSQISEDYDAVFLGIGLVDTNDLGIEGEGLEGVEDAVDFIAKLRQSHNLRNLPIGRRVVVIGGGMTAIDAATQAKLLGAEEVTLVYRRGQDKMPASEYEQDLAASKGVHIVCNAAPVKITGGNHVEGIEFAYTDDNAKPLDETFTLPADQVFKAIGQTLGDGHGLEIDGRKIAVSGAGRTTRPGIWAGGDCAAGGDDLTVTAVAEGRDAAEDIHASLMG
ncbi:NAD(P)-dependent oxidoreductase [Maritimibacter dapengensis]|uniref:NAD(P)-dependent oxidoreductase n=1 Tax=Maritimibacter dapengensis TaxID=2836868 RepID=A0ABS6T6S3_9RHOB|nr:NAD(P)-dependent oxidoreductase [Maritimibacter dapengensis]MBV7380206.1 NAD(P)-dependent oxidoreductase [Maritimibacter dapengensis]